MNAGRTVFSQLIEFLPHHEFQKCVARYAGDRYLKNLSCWDQYLAMAFAQLTYRESLRDTCAPSRMFCSNGAIPTRSIRAPVFAPIRLSSSHPSNQPRRIPMHCGV